MTKTTKYDNMLSSFNCDFTLAENGQMKLAELDDLIKKEDKKLLKDIELLSELDFNLRHGKIQIVEVN